MVRQATEEDRAVFDSLAPHPLQSFAWGDFREKTGLAVSRLIRSEGKRIVETALVTWHKLPLVGKVIGYLPKSGVVSEEMMEALIEEGKKRGTVMIKMEPLIEEKTKEADLWKKSVSKFGLKIGKSLFTKYTMILDLSLSEEQILAQMHPKTRYNLRLSERKGVKVEMVEDMKYFEDYWKLMSETTIRQGFFAHTKRYHQLMFETLSKSGMARMLTAKLDGKVLVCWVIFLQNDTLYYPYGASTRDDKNVFASNLVMWEAIRWGKKMGAVKFDMWGSLGFEPDVSDPWYGFHRFKQGFGAKVIEFVGTYDLVIDSAFYPIYVIVNDYLRPVWLKVRAKLR